MAGRAAPRPELVQEVGCDGRVAVGWSYSAMGVSYLDIGKAEMVLRYFQRMVEGRVPPWVAWGVPITNRAMRGERSGT